MHLTVAIATTGRRAVLSKVLAEFARQSRQPDELIVCPALPEDVDSDVLAALPFKTQSILSKVRGLPAQRNTILAALQPGGVAIFFDDDFVPAVNFLDEVEKAFERYPDMAMLTGHVLADGVHIEGIPFEDALVTLAQDTPPQTPTVEPIYNCYGCNMALRTDLVRRHAVLFDENLPLYAWLEDVDFSRRMAAFGDIIKSAACRGVHLATKKGKGSGRRLGYSQIANPLYLWGKGTMSPSRAAAQMGRNVSANLTKVLFPEPWVDRRGRLVGNALAALDAVSGRLHPRRIEDL